MKEYIRIIPIRSEFAVTSVTGSTETVEAQFRGYRDAFAYAHVLADYMQIPVAPQPEQLRGIVE
ncbi:hypothetical protein [Marivita sp.]|uniref:hypothetical protein n=1 Tax=Marivita sp. TaxID=2003365 RepID=UPI003B5968AA